MSTKSKYRPWRFPKNRLETFSDGVFAIVITLLVLELKVPTMAHMEDTKQVVAELMLVLPKVFSWIVSFFFVALVWMHHHQIMHMSTMSNYKVVWINIFLLLFISFLPFPTALMGHYPGQPLIVTIWGLTMFLVTFSLALLYAYCSRYFLRPEYDPAVVRKHVIMSFLASPVLYLLAASLSWWSLKVAYTLYVLVPLLFIMPLDRELATAGGDIPEED